jgi:hypothetical protein
MKSVDLPTEVRSPLTARTLALAPLRELIDDSSSDHPLYTFVDGAYRSCGGSSWPQTFDAWLAESDAGEGLAKAARLFALEHSQAMALAIAYHAEIDPAFARVVAWLQAPVAGARPTLGLLAAAIARLAGRADVLALKHGRAAALELVTWAETGESVAAQEARVPDPVLIAIGGAPASSLCIGGAETGTPCSSQQAILDGAVDALRRLGVALVLRSPDLDEARNAAGHVARKLGRPVWLERPAWPPGLAAACAIDGQVPVFTVTAAPGERVEIPAPRVPQLPVLIVAGSEGAVSVGGATCAELTLPLPAPEERRERWLTSGFDPPAAELLARRWRCSTARIDALASAARFEAAERGAEPTTADVAAVARVRHASMFDGVGRVLSTDVDDDDLILTESTRSELRRLVSRCSVREQLPVALRGAAACAVRALFAGPTGTGKSLAARWLAAQLGLPLVAVDLAALTSKWIGETEKNLAQVFARAEGSSAILLFDEADSVFGARTDVGSANDRFANNQTNYLLSRMESFDGIVVLTSNSRQRIDHAFLRRLDVVIEFGVPGPQERRLLWERHLGPAAESGFIERMAGAIDLPGGSVAGAALAARALALAEARPLAAEDVLIALRAEYQKLGRSVPAELRADSDKRRA